MKKKKYSLGTGRTGVVNNYLVSPQEVLAQNSINTAKAMEAGATNDFANVLDMLGKFTMSNGKNIAGALQTGNEAAFGGTVGGNIEVEGKEVAETPNGDFLNFSGASHEQGGIDTNLPEGTNIFSKRILVEGKTMAERKIARNKKLDKISALLEKNSSDSAIKKTHERTYANLQKEEESDLATQEMIDMFLGVPKGEQRKAAWGEGLISNIFSDVEDPIFNDFSVMPTDNASLDMGISTDSPINQKIPTTTAPGTYTDITAPILTDTNQIAGFNTSSAKPPVNIEELFSSLFGNTSKGDAVSIVGDLMSTFGPLKNTLANRATDTPNVNSYKDFGKDALDANDQAQNYAQSLKTNADKKILLGKNANIKRGRNSARGVNAMRAVDIANEMQANQAQANTSDSLAQQMLQLLSQRSGLENQQDQVVMQGEAQRDLADRQDKDNFYTQKGKDLSTKATGVQQIGKDLNAIKQREIMKALIEQMSKYGITLDKDYKLTEKDNG